MIEFDRGGVHECCWHYGKKILLSDPPKGQRKCCICGRVDTFAHRYRGGVLEEDEHGPYLDKEFPIHYRRC